jgi:hypothetical protein
MIKCKVCKDGGVLERVGSNYCCMKCGTVSNSFVPEATLDENFTYRDRSSYRKGLIDQLANRQLSEKRQHRIFHVMQAYKDQIGRLYEMREYSIEIQKECELTVRKIAERCYVAQEENGKNVSLSRSPLIMCTACLYIVFTNTRPFYGAINPKRLLIPDSGEKNFEKKVTKLKQRIESNPYINIFNCGILNQVKEITKVEHLYDCTCNKLDIPYKNAHIVFALYMHIIDNVQLKGKNINSIVGAVLLHCFKDGDERCKNSMIEPSTYTLTEDQIKLLCEELNIRKKTLDQCVSDLQCVCCQPESKKRKKRESKKSEKKQKTEIL